jgi:hypothetical protein
MNKNNKILLTVIEWGERQMNQDPSLEFSQAGSRDHGFDTVSVFGLLYLPYNLS